VTPDELSPYLSQFQVKPGPEDLQRKMKDLMYTSMYILAAAQQPGKRVAMDFVTLHSATTSVFYPVILAQEGLTNVNKARILETAGRTSATMYAACGSPTLDTRAILDYQPRFPEHGWPELIHRAIVYRDEGHAAKLVRALYSTEQLGEPMPGFPISKADLIKIAHMGIDSIELAFDEKNGNGKPAAGPGIMARVGHGGEMVVNNMTRWIFYGGLEHSWDHIPEV
jgi:oxidoreductase AflY